MRRPKNKLRDTVDESRPLHRSPEALALREAAVAWAENKSFHLEIDADLLRKAIGYAEAVRNEEARLRWLDDHEESDDRE